MDEELYDLETASSSFDIDIRCYATMNTITSDTINVKVPSVNTAANFVNYLYDSHSKSTATVNNITYNLASLVGLMNDRLGGTTTSLDGGDIRYYGANPNNYVWLGDTYTSQFTSDSSSYKYKTWQVDNKKLWRIIGSFGGRLRLISDAPISTTQLSWDTSANNTTGGNSGGGINQWGESTYSDTGAVYSGADLMRLLNPGYEEESINNSLYWNKGTGTVYTGYSNATTSNVSFANTGLTNEEKNMIDNATWYFGLYNSLVGNYVDLHYVAERQSDLLGKPCTSGIYCNDTVVRTPTWSGKVGLVYPSDLGYATDLSLCDSQLDSRYVSSSLCYRNVWIRGIFKTISPSINSSKWGGGSTVFEVSISSNLLSYSNAAGSSYIYPSIYLKPNVVITEGNGTEDNPYVLSLG